MRGKPAQNQRLELLLLHEWSLLSDHREKFPPGDLEFQRVFPLKHTRVHFKGKKGNFALPIRDKGE